VTQSWIEAEFHDQWTLSADELTLLPGPSLIFACSSQIFDLAAITQAGGWKSTRMPLQYAEKINAARSGMARAAAVTGRDEPVSE
jgi:hypothetical protein